MKKFNYRRLKFNTWFYFLIFTAVIIACIWIFQFVSLDWYYTSTKFSSMREYGGIIGNSLSVGDNVSEHIEECRDMDIGVAIVYADSVGNPPETYGPGPSFNESFVTFAEENLLKSGDESYSGQYIENGSHEKDKTLLYYIQKTTYNGENAYLILVSPYTKLSEAVNVLKIESAVITAITLAISFILAWYFSGKLSRPIDDMSETAKRWADGDNSVVFNVKNSYTEISELADALNYAKDGVSRAGELQRDLLANVSHDLKTPLTMIKAYAEMIKDISGDDKQKREKHTQVIIDEADRLTMLVNDILNLSKLQSSVDDLVMTEINLSELTERVIGRFSDYVENNGYKIEDGIAPDLITFADEKKVEQVIYNLLGNSINYTGEDKTVKVYLTAENDKILLEIIDSGKGISAESLDTIWERYYRFSETNTRPVKGTGLGLSIVKAILEKHKLKYGVRSKENCGSNFYVEFNRIKNE
ncbi:MAG: HAMP domain-containing histidine kinase [Clostridia bacterium]|nr:HAMP domain-containing histidine kinase [Clostridia bacterium]